MREQDSTKRMILRQHAGQHMHRAEWLERSGRWDEAIAELKNAVKLDPGVVEAYAALGHHYRRKGLLAKSAEAFRRAVALSDDYEDYFNLGHVLVDLGRYREAEEAYSHCLKLRPDDLAVRYEIAYALFSSERYAEALPILEQLIAAHPEDWEVAFLRASCRLGMRAYDLAEMELKRAMEVAPDDEAHMILQEHLAMVMRYREFASDPIVGVKDKLYVEYGATCLGSALDDGLKIERYKNYAFDYVHIARTLLRLVAVCKGLAQAPSTIVPADAQSLPIAVALADLFGVPIVSLASLQVYDMPLVTMGVCSGPELHDLILERISVDPIMFALSVDWSNRVEFMPDIVGVFTERPSTLPWQATSDWELWANYIGGLSVFLRRTHAGQAVHASAKRLIQQTRNLRPDPNLADQVAYYTLRHRQLRWIVDPSSDQPKRESER